MRTHRLKTSSLLLLMFALLRVLHSFPTRRSSDLAGFLIVEDKTGAEGKDKLSHIGTLKFTDGTIETNKAPSVNLSVPICESLSRSEEHTSELQSQFHLVCRRLLEKRKSS